MNNQEGWPSTQSQLHALIDVSEALRDAMRARDPDRIQAVVAMQDDLVRRCATHPPRRSESTQESPDDQRDLLVDRLRRLQAANRLMASAFLKLYQSSWRELSGTVGRDPGVYGNAGRLTPTPASPMLVRQTG